MGLFSLKKTTYVSSVAYNLGGDEEDQPDFLKHTALNAVMQGRPVGESITQSYLRGQGLSLRNLYENARLHYPNGLPASAAVYLDRPDLDALTAVLVNLHKGSTITFLATYVGTADYEWWAEQYLAQTFGYDRVEKEFIRPPAGVEATASVTYDLEPDGLIRILLTNDDGQIHVVDFRPKDVQLNKTYIHCAYKTTQVFNKGTTTSTHATAPGEVDMVQVSMVEVERAGETQQTYTKVSTDVEGALVTVTTEVTVTIISRPQYFLYRIGSNIEPTLESIAPAENLESPYYPTIPIRVNNVDFTDEEHQETELYKQSEKLLKKIGVKFADIADSVNENESIKDVDFAFIVFGVSLNTKSQCGKRYLYKFFEYLRSKSVYLASDQADWEASATRSTTPPKINVLEVFNEKKRADDYDIKLQWQYIDTSVHTGQITPGAKVGDCSLEMTGVQVAFHLFNMDLSVDSSKLYARKQLTENTYEQMEICGLVYDNYIYKGKSVNYTAYEAMHNEDDGDAFIIPLNQKVLRELGIKHMTQLSYEAGHVVFNCYKVVKQKWYQTTLFKIIIVIIAILIIVFTWGAGTPAAAGMIAGALAAVGITGMLMIYLAATLYVLAMMILSNIIMKVSVDVFGEKWGAIIGMIVSVIAMNYASTGTALGSFASIGTNGITAGTLIQGMSAVGQLYGSYVNGQLVGIGTAMQELQDEYKTKMDEIEQLTKEFLSPGTNLLDIGGYIESSKSFLMESSASFLNRTLMTGEDVIMITNGLIENFASVGLSTDLPATG